MALQHVSKMPKYLAFLAQHFSVTISPKQAKSPEYQGFFGGGVAPSKSELNADSISSSEIVCVPC